jgi:glycine cleavage system H protein
MSEPMDLKYSKTHEWVRIEGDFATVGITQHAQEELGDVALVLFPEIGRFLQRGEKFGEIESIKAVSDLYAPVGGEVVAVNEALNETPEKVNDAPYGDGWLLRLKMSQVSDANLLLDAAAYEETL